MIKISKVKTLRTNSQSGQNFGTSFDPNAYNTFGSNINNIGQQATQAIPNTFMNQPTAFDTNISTPMNFLTPEKILEMNKMFGTQFDASTPQAEITDALKSLDAQGKIGDPTAFDWKGGLDLASSATGVGLGIASYFDQAGVNKLRKQGLRENIATARQERTAKQDFRDKTATSFA